MPKTVKNTDKSITSKTATGKRGGKFTRKPGGKGNPVRGTTGLRTPSVKPVAPGRKPVTPSGKPGRVVLSNNATSRAFGKSIHILPDRPMHSFSNDYRILSIDGGGARGMIPATILKEVEARTGKRIHKMFDRICGTSTGSILTCGLTAPRASNPNRSKYSAEQIVEIYRDLGEVIFSRGSFQDRVVGPAEELMDRSPTWIASHAGQALDTVKSIYNEISKPLHDVHKLAYHLHDKLGDLRMSDALTEAFVYAYDIGSRTPEAIGSRDSTIPGTRNYSSYRMWQAATASSAAVPFFSPYRIWEDAVPPVNQLVQGMINLFFTPNGSGDFFDLIDGGNAGLGNPTLFGLMDETEESRSRNKVVLSLGTGHFSQPIPDASTGWGFIEWLGDGGELLNNMFDGESDVTDMTLRSMAGDDLSYFRWQPALPQSLAFLDEGSRQDMDALQDIARAFIAENDEEIDELVEIINTPRLRRLETA